MFPGPRGGCLHQPIGMADRRRQVSGDLDPLGAENLLQIARQGRGAARVDVEDEQTFDAEFQEGVGGGGACASGAKLHNPGARSIG